MRSITASDKAAILIDKGEETSSKLEKLTSEDKKLKSQIVDLLSCEIGKEETSVRVEGDRAAVIITAAEKVSIKVGAEQFDGVRKAVLDGILPCVTMGRSLAVPPSEVEEAAKILKEAGLIATVSETFTVKAEDVRKMKSSEVTSKEESVARRSLEECLETSTSYRVKYDAIKGEAEEREEG